MALDKSKLREIAVLFLIVTTAAVLFWELKGFLSAVLGASVVYIVLRKPQFYLEEKRKFPSWVAATLLMLLSFLVLVIPVLTVSVMLSGKIGFLQSHYGELVILLERWLERISDFTEYKISDGMESLSGLAQTVFSTIPDLLKATAAVVTDILILYIVLFFMLTGGRSMERKAISWLPFQPENKRLLLEELKQMTMSNAIGAPIVAVVQGIVSWVAYLIAGVDEPIFWAVLTGLLSFIPLLGTALVWLPLGLVLYFQGTHWQGLFILLYGASVITNIDNLIRLWIQKKLGDVHPLVTFFGVIVGLDLFGIVGLVFGPLLISYLFILIKIYSKEFSEPS